MPSQQLNQFEEVISRQTQDGRIACPSCSQDRRKAGRTDMSITVEPNKILYYCHHCTMAGVIDKQPFYQKYLETKKENNVVPIPTPLTESVRPIIDWFADRGVVIDPDNKLLPPMTFAKHYFHGYGELDAIGFIYGDPQQPDAIKWRATEYKAFTQQNAASEFYGIDLYDGTEKEIVIVEGEADVVALASVGIKSISCPNGAPMKVSERRIDPEEDKKFSYVWEARDLLDSVERIILAVDSDQAGEALSEELARRIGRAKCWRVNYPAETKDPTDVLNKLGTKTMLELIKKAEPLPLMGVYSADEFKGDVRDLYEKGYVKGESTGLPKVDELFTVKEGMFYVVTGHPSSGKSEFVDQLMVNLAKNKSWKFAVASFENPVHYHIMKLTEKIIEKPFMKGLNKRVTPEELDAAHEFINDHFVFLQNRDGGLPTIDNLLERVSQAIRRLGIRCAVIDPYNYIEHHSNEAEHLQISKMLTKIVAFAQANQIAIFMIAHPAKMYRRDDGSIPIPRGGDISGSAAWFAKCDCGITVHRGDMGVEIHCWKMRFKWIGQQGQVTIGYDVPTGTYYDAVDVKWEEW